MAYKKSIAYENSGPLKLHGLWKFLACENSWLWKFMAYGNSWPMKLHGLWKSMSYEIPQPMKINGLWKFIAYKNLWPMKICGIIRTYNFATLFNKLQWIVCLVQQSKISSLHATPVQFWGATSRMHLQKGPSPFAIPLLQSLFKHTSNSILDSVSLKYSFISDRIKFDNFSVTIFSSSCWSWPCLCRERSDKNDDKTRVSLCPAQHVKSAHCDWCFASVYISLHTFFPWGEGRLRKEYSTYQFLTRPSVSE